MNARHAVVMAGLICFLATPGLADDRGRHRGYEPGRRDAWQGESQRRHEINPGGWNSRNWRGGHHERPGYDSGFRTIQPYGAYGGVRPYSIERPPIVVIVPPPPAFFYWYCADPAGYYPYVPSCHVFWQRVPATRWP